MVVADMLYFEPQTMVDTFSTHMYEGVACRKPPEGVGVSKPSEELGAKGSALTQLTEYMAVEKRFFYLHAVSLTVQAVHLWHLSRFISAS
jgi:hypothetical protein